MYVEDIPSRLSARQNSFTMMMMLLLLLHLLSVLFHPIVCNSQRLRVHSSRGGRGGREDDKERGINLKVDLSTGSATIDVDDRRWFELNRQAPSGSATIKVLGWNDMYLKSQDVTHGNRDPTLSSMLGPYTRIRFRWEEKQKKQTMTMTMTDGDNDDIPRTLETGHWIFEDSQVVIFEQVFPDGWTNPGEPAANFGPNSPSQIVVGWPSIGTTLGEDLLYLVWGDCFAAGTDHGRWKDKAEEDLSQMFNGHTHGQPWMLHDENGRSTVWSNLDNFFVSGFAYNNITVSSASTSSSSTINVGLRNTLESIPSNFRHKSVMVAGSGINQTLMDWGDVLLAYGAANKARSQVYDDFLLAHMGYFTDNGAYHYMAAHEEKHANMEEALLDVKKTLKERMVPIRYVQWDDWWMESTGDMPGMLSWQPKPDIFPSGFTSWLDMPLSMYAPGYSGKNVWIDDYEWKITNTSRGLTSIPTDVGFYLDLFRNGTKIGMKLFEQDFLCSYGIGGTGLTSTDVYSGSDWLNAINDAALAYNVSVQLCMANTYHLMFSTTLRSVTNARATDDNTRNYAGIYPMGQNGLLFYALGIFASRDNVWTSRADVEQKGCGNKNFCFEPNAHLDNAVTVLSNGPYGIADAVAHVNRTVVMYGCREDGWMLRPRTPLAALDFMFTEEQDIAVWAAHDDHGGYRWSYILGVNLTKSVLISPRRLGLSATTNGSLVAWHVIPGNSVSKVVISPFLLPESEPLNLPYEMDSPSHTHFSTAPVLSNGMVILGETGKWATMSFGRVTSFQEADGSVFIVIKGAPSEHVKYSYMKTASDSVRVVDYVFPDTCPDMDQYQNPVCHTLMTCNTNDGCEIDDVTASISWL